MSQHKYNKNPEGFTAVRVKKINPAFNLWKHYYFMQI